MGEGRGEREIAKEQNFNSKKKKMVAPAMHWDLPKVTLKMNEMFQSISIPTHIFSLTYVHTRLLK